MRRKQLSFLWLEVGNNFGKICSPLSSKYVTPNSRDISHVCGCIRDGLDASTSRNCHSMYKLFAVCVIIVQENETIHAVTQHF